MATIKNFRADGSANIVVPIQAGTNSYVITGIDRAIRTHQWSIRFFNTADVDENTPLATVTAGTVLFEASSEIRPLRFREVPNGSFDAADYNNNNQDAPAAAGQVVATQLTLANIAGATHFIAQYEGQ